MRNLINTRKHGAGPLGVSTCKSGSLGEGSQETSSIRTIFNLAYERTHTRPNRSAFVQGDALKLIFEGISVSSLSELLAVPYATAATYKFNYEHGKLSDSKAKKILTKLNFTLKSEPVWKLNLPK